MAGTKFSGFTTGATADTTFIVGYDGDAGTNNQYSLGQLMVGLIGADSGLTTGSVVFVGASGSLTQDNSNFFWNDEDNNLKVVKRKLSITSSTDGDVDGDVVYFGTGTTAVGKIYYFDGTDWLATDANTASSAASKGLLGVALGTAPATNGMLIRGMITLDHDPGTIGDILYLSGTASEATSTAPSASGDTVRQVGYCLDSTNGQIYFDPSPTYIELA